MAKRTTGISQDELEMVLERSLVFRQTEKTLQGAVGTEAEARARIAHRTAKSRWRDATDHILRKPP